MDTPQTHNQSIVAKWQVSSTVAKKRKPNSRISLNTPDSPRALSPAPTTTPGEQPVAGPSTSPLPAPTPVENQSAPAPRTKKAKTATVNVEQLAAKYAPPTRKLNELGGLDEQIDQLLEVVGLPLRRPEMYFQMGTERPKGVLLHGVQGGGKTQLVNCLAGVSCSILSGTKLMTDVHAAIHQSLGTFDSLWNVWRIRKDIEGYI
jgi:ribosome biogenesis ATPase